MLTPSVYDVLLMHEESSEGVSLFYSAQLIKY